MGEFFNSCVVLQFRAGEGFSTTVDSHAYISSRKISCRKHAGVITRQKKNNNWKVFIQSCVNHVLSTWCTDTQDALTPADRLHSLYLPLCLELNLAVAGCQVICQEYENLRRTLPDRTVQGIAVLVGVMATFWINACLSREVSSLTPQGILEGMIRTLDLTLSAPDDCISPSLCSDPDGLCVLGFTFAAIADPPVKDWCRMLRFSKLYLDTWS